MTGEQGRGVESREGPSPPRKISLPALCCPAKVPVLQSGCWDVGVASPCMQSTKVSQQEGFQEAVQVFQSSDRTEEREGISGEGRHTPAHLIFTATQRDQRYTAHPDLGHCPGYSRRL